MNRKYPKQLKDLMKNLFLNKTLKKKMLKKYIFVDPIISVKK